MSNKVKAMSFQADLGNSIANRINPEVNPEKSFHRLAKPPYLQPNPLLYCIFCTSANHISHQCHKYKCSKDYWQKVLEDRRCKNCLRLYHQSNKCFNRSFCNVIGCRRTDKHSPVLCHGRYMNNQPFFNSQFQRTFLESHSVPNVSTSFLSRYSSLDIKNDLQSNEFSRKMSPFHRFRRKPRYKKGSIPSRNYNFKEDSLRFPIGSNGGVSNPEFVTSGELKSTQKNSQGLQINVCSVVDASTQTEWEESKSSEPKFSQGCQTQKCVSTISIQTDIVIPPAIYIPPPPPVDWDDDVKIQSEVLEVKEDCNVNIPHYENCRVDDKSFVRPSPSIPNFLRSALDSLVTELKPKEQKPFGFTSFPHWK